MQGFLITAYREPSYLSDLINQITAHGDRVWLHIDRKSSFTEHDLSLHAPQSVEVLQRYSIKWGGMSHLDAIILLMRHALTSRNASYFHIISGQDAIVRYPSADALGDTILMNALKVTPDDTVAMRRLEQYNCFPNSDTRKKMVRAINKIVFDIQRKTVHTRTHIPGMDDTYKGVVWSSMPRLAMQFVLDYNDEHPEYMKFIRHTLIPEEFFLQSIIMNSPLKHNVTGSNERYTDWTMRNGSLPAYLDETDYHAITEGNYLFARKIDQTISGGLLNLLYKSSISA
ncbi:branching protein [Bifidobacterium pseudolongum subsp. globosum]|uniref:beta-1,6-N-acetylglucosaminyltransferase n=1 Tax=Bifidobacterium pseudolongum TaxID=1694 RepID=UPI000C70429E|nr:beta-1,6-N-acetylglucosaminyltransferase [Bifidobacterium pseudolongum]PKU94770.1 branching protein [Bifidobacterium pseudolongum subsp. globosum]RYP99132.1 branching protein [Bifidobacterium pseudolongum subsp. globosum]